MGPSEYSAVDGPCQRLPPVTEVAPTWFNEDPPGWLLCAMEWGRRRALTATPAGPGTQPLLEGIRGPTQFNGDVCDMVSKPFTTVVNMDIMSTVDLVRGGICQ